MTTQYHKGTGQELYIKAKKLIPGGTQLLSKRPELHLPDQWPAYYSKTEGCFSWDMDGRKLIDFSTPGIGACSLGFNDKDVNEAVKAVIDAGSMCSLNTPDEVELAELLCELHPWADMVRYARCGGEIMSVAARIARSYAGKDMIAICGYHGWHDWYLAANLGDNPELDGHLLPGLAPAGVPRSLAGSVTAFRYNNIEEFREMIAKHGDKLAAIVMEPIRFDEPAEGFLEEIRATATERNIVLVFDEISSGWRFETGGAHLSMGVNPDIAVFAKSISNGYPMAAVIGKADVMQAAQDSFISSTYWTESIGPAAALATIKKMQKIKLPQILKKVGEAVHAGWRTMAAKHGLDITIEGRPALGHFSLNYDEQSPALATLFTQEMLDRGYIAKTAFYAIASHTPELIADYLAAVDEVFAILKEAVDAGNAEQRLRGPIAHSGFRRLT